MRSYFDVSNTPELPFETDDYPETRIGFIMVWRKK